KMAIKIKKIDEKNKVSRYLVKGTTPALLNAIRRSVMLHVPCLAIDEVKIYENNSVMFDEFLAHRLGMLPLQTDSKGYKTGEKVKLVLEKEGSCMVYSKDIKSTDPKIEVIDKKIPIVKLGKDQKLKAEMQAVMQAGKEHSKWQPAIVAYQELPVVYSEKECNQCGQCIEACPKSVLEIQGKKVVLKDAMECILCGACRDACERDALTVDAEKGSYILHIEPIAGMSENDIIGNAVQELQEKAKDFGKLLSKVKGG
ncbi:MAG: DNA-directed RNA polymerase subunit D, partial [Candidatus Diapherotrites archaeon]|nr:DNA-directed RNA polymerase subunit D [Candidatus Diapherotrites archaeon]